MNDLTIERVHAWEALDSRGRPTVGCRVDLTSGRSGRAIVPSGASTGSYEALERRDGGERYGGFGVQRAVGAVNTVLAPLVRGESAGDRIRIDALIEEADGDVGFGRFGGNAALAVSLAVTLANAEGRGQPLWRTLDDSERPLLPMPMINILSGGAHAGKAIDLQDFLVVPLGAESFSRALEWTTMVRAECALLIDAAGGWSALVADEGGLSARLPGNEAALRILAAGIENAGFSPGEEVAIAVDVAASQLTVDGRIVLADDNQSLSPEEWTEQFARWVDRYPIISVEDILGEDEWNGWQAATARMPTTQMLGDDLFATNPERLERGIRENVANAVLVKVNQAGSVSRAERVMNLARASGYATVVSARSGDTEDHWLADLAVGWRSGQIKVGSTMRSERTAKWNRLLEIESEGLCEFAGAAAFLRS